MKDRLSEAAYEIERLQDDTRMLWDAVAEKNAEIERLGRVIVNLHKEQREHMAVIRDRDDEIERLRKDKLAWHDVVASQQAEIERLSAEIKREPGA